MRLEIAELFGELDNLILQYDEFDSPMSVSELKKCENAIVDRDTILIDGQLGHFEFCEISHPSGCAKLHICRFYPIS